MKHSISANKWFPVFSVLLLLAVWQVVALSVGNPLLLPSPWTAFLAVVKIFRTGGFFTAVGATLLRGILGFALSMLAGVAAGVAAGLNPTVHALLNPLVITIRSTPVISVILLALIWFSNDSAPVFIGFLIMFPIISTNVQEGIRAVDPGLVEMARLYRVKKPRILRDVYFPAITPFFFSGASNAAGIGWKAIIASEVLSQPNFAIGTRMQNAQTYLLVSEVIAWTLVAILLSTLFELVLRRAEKRLVPWKREKVGR